MPNQLAADDLARDLPHLMHPGDDTHGPTPLILPVFRQQLPDDQAQKFANDAGLPHADLTKLTAEAVVHSIESKGRTIIDNAELAELRRAAQVREPERTKQLHFHCTCETPLFRAVVRDFDTDKPRINPNVIRALKNVSAECSTGHR